MNEIYTAIDGRNYKTEKECLKRNNYINEVQKTFDKLIDIGFFATDKILKNKFFQINKFGNPKKSDFDFNILGYIKIHGYQQNDVYIRFKLRNNKFIALIYDEEDNRNHFLKTIYLDQIFKEEYRTQKISKLCM